MASARYVVNVILMSLSASYLIFVQLMCSYLANHLSMQSLCRCYEHMAFNGCHYIINLVWKTLAVDFLI